MIVRHDHPALSLWSEHSTLGPYPDGCFQVPEAIPHTAFFPGGYGLWHPKEGSRLPEWPRGGVMVLDHDFHSEDGYRDSLALGMEPTSQPTWRSLSRMLEEAGISATSCFFTNFYMGLRRGSGTTGRYPGPRSEAFVRLCREFLVRQLDAQRPRLVLTLGAWVPSLAAELGGGLEVWRGAKTLKEIDAHAPIPRDVRLHAGSPCVVAALSHPSFCPRSASTRAYIGLRGPDAHSQLLRDAVLQAR